MIENLRGGVSWEADRRLTIVETLLGQHLKSCEQRGATLAKLAWIALGTNLAILGVLLRFVLQSKGIIIP